MNERDRLIELLDKKQYYGSATGLGVNYIQNSELADYLLENGLIVPPCKVGDIVYKIINDKRVKKPYKCKVIGFWHSGDESCNNIHLAHYVNGVFESSFSVPFTEIGKTVFFTGEEAENALKER